MTNLSTTAAGILEEFSGGTTGDFDMMVGVGLVKGTDAVFFEYLGDDAEPAALMLRSGKALAQYPTCNLLVCLLLKTLVSSTPPAQLAAAYYCRSHHPRYQRSYNHLVTVCHHFTDGSVQRW